MSGMGDRVGIGGIGRREMFGKIIDKAIIRRYPYKTRDQIEAEVLIRREEIGRRIAMRMTRGNIRIAAGRFLTREYLDARRLLRS